jgi:MFS family permease
MRNEQATVASTSSAVTSAKAPAPPTSVQIKPIDRRYVTAALCLVMVLASMEMTVTSTAMPTIIGELHGLEHYSWVASIYLLAMTVTMPLYGRLADTLGRKRVILFAILLFCVSSVLASMARSMPQLIAYRGLQGLAAGGIMPIVLTILGDIFTLEERARIQGVFSSIWGTSSLAGPALGAFLVNTFGWRSVFFVNLPFGLLGLLVLMWKYHDREKPHTTDLDLPGVASLSVACLAALTLVSRLGPDGWSWPTASVLLAVAVLMTIYFVRHERLAGNPIIPAEFLKHRAIGPSIICTFLFGICFLSLDTYVPLYVQGGRGGGATAAAGVVTPVMLTWALSGPISAPLIVRWGFRKLAMIGAAFIVVGFVGLLVCAILNLPQTLITAILAITGLGFGPSSMSYLLAAQDAVGWQQRGGVTGTVSFFRSIGGSLGVGLMGALFNVLIAPDMDRLRALGIKPAALLDPHEHAKLSPEALGQAHHMIARGLTWVFAAMVVVALVQLIVTTLMPKHRKPDHVPTPAEAMEATA